MFRPFASVLSRWTGTITHVDTDEPVAALTFDDGPDPLTTPRVLSVLERYDARATFFMLGQAAQRHTETMHQVAAAGHAIANHSFDHPSFPLVAGQERRRQIRTCAKTLAPFGVRLFRPPFGDQDAPSRLDALLSGYQVVTWSLMGIDWLEHDGAWIARRLIDGVRPGSILLLHDTVFGATGQPRAERGPMIEALSILLESTKNQLRFVTLPELLRSGTPQRRTWIQAPDAAFQASLSRGTEPS